MATTPISRTVIYAYEGTLFTITFCFQGREFYWRQQFQKIWKPARGREHGSTVTGTIEGSGAERKIPPA